MNINKELLTTRLSILMGRESLNFLTNNEIEAIREIENLLETVKEIIF